MRIESRIGSPGNECVDAPENRFDGPLTDHAAELLGAVTQIARAVERGFGFLDEFVHAPSGGKLVEEQESRRQSELVEQAVNLLLYDKPTNGTPMPDARMSGCMRAETTSDARPSTAL